MYPLFIHILSQGLQAFMPVAIAAAWLRRTAPVAAAPVVRFGTALAIPVSGLAGVGFLRSLHHAEWMAALAVAAIGVLVWFAVADHARTPRLLLAAAASLIIARETMQIVAVLVTAVVDLHRADVAAVIGAGAAVPLALAVAWTRIAARLPDRALARATRAFAWIFLAQLLLYAFHMLAEARLLPMSEALHLATEPYGPEGPYGQYASGLLVAVPVVAAAASAWYPTDSR